jgi:Na+-driven multidrug efflux pump
MTITYTIEFVTVLLLAHNVPRLRKALFWPTKESFDDWAEYFAVSVPATIMICASWWGFELVIVASSYLGVSQLAANVIMQNISVVQFMVPLGF